MQHSSAPDELSATMLGVRMASDPPRCVKALRMAELLLHLGVWIGVVTAAVLDGHADGFDPARIAGEVRHYEWRTSTADAVLIAAAAALIGAVAALTRRPPIGLLASVVSCVALVVKCATLLGHRGSFRSSCAAAALVSSACLLIAMALQTARVVHRENKRSSTRLNDDLEADAAADDYGLAGLTRRKADGTKRGASVGRLLTIAGPERGMLLFATFCLAGSTTSQMAMPAFFGGLLSVITSSSGGSGSEYHALSSVTVKLIAILIVGGTFSFFRGYLFNLAGERVCARIRKALFAHLISLEIAFFDSSKTGELLNRLSSDTTALQYAVTSNISMGLRFGAQAIFSVCAVFVIQWRLALVQFGVLPAIALIAVVYGSFVKRVSKRYQQALADASDVAQEKLSSLRTVRSFGMEAAETATYAAAVTKSYNQGAKRALGYGAFAGVISVLAQSAIVVVLWYGGTLVLHDSGVPGGFDVGTLTTFLLYCLSLATAFGGLTGLFSATMTAVGASERIFDLFDRTTAISNRGGEVLSNYRGVLTLKDVTFSYPTRTDHLVLDSVSLTIQPGTVVALCGPSGSGKSSIINLIERFYDPQGGMLLVDGIPLTKLDASWWRQQAALVAQEPVLFACSIRDNITYGARPAEGASAISDDAVVHAARTANAHTFVSSFPDGYKTTVGERGVQLSGGQKQRVAIARAILADPRMLLLDEATSALDAESEHVVQEAIDRLMTNRTTVVVAHRLSTIAGADTICVVHKGRIAEQGSHAELVSAGGIYKQLVSRQLAGSSSPANASALDLLSSQDDAAAGLESATAPSGEPH